MRRKTMDMDLFDLQLFADELEDSKDDLGKEEEQQNAVQDENKPELKYSDADVDRIIQEKKAKWEKQAEAKEEEAKKLAKMNAKEKAEHERDKLQKEIDELKREKALADMTKEARKMCADANLHVSDEILATIITPDADTTKQAVESFIDLFKSETERAVKEALKGGSFKKGPNGNAITREDILKIKDPIERQKLIRTHMELFR